MSVKTDKDKIKSWKTAIIFIGIPASGKSTFYNRYFKEQYIHINLDSLHTRNKEKLLFDHCLAEGKSFVVDNTNPTKADRQRYISMAKAAGYRVAGYFFQSIVGECVARNENRQGKAKVPGVAIAGISNKLELPDQAEGFDELFFVSMEGQDFTVDLWKGENYEFS